MKCAVKNCENKNHVKGVKKNFFTFPKDNKLLAEWILFCERKDQFKRNSWRICSDHFKETSFSGGCMFDMGKLT